VINFLRKTYMYKLWVLFRLKREEKNSINYWIQSGKPIPPPHAVKYKTIKEFQKKYSHDTFIETGTYLGAMIESCRANFKTLYSIELSEELQKRACQRFEKHKNIHLICGDSAVKLPELLKEISSPCIFWLDGHFSSGITAKGDKDTPINEEINSIFQHSIKNHVILIDDARLFNGQNDYPEINYLKQNINLLAPEYYFEVIDDIIRIYKP